MKIQVWFVFLKNLKLSAGSCSVYHRHSRRTLDVNSKQLQHWLSDWESKSMSSKENYRIELRTAIRQLSDRCLYAASKWYPPNPKTPNSNSNFGSLQLLMLPSFLNNLQGGRAACGYWARPGKVYSCKHQIPARELQHSTQVSHQWDHFNASCWSVVRLNSGDGGRRHRGWWFLPSC